LLKKAYAKYGITKFNKIILYKDIPNLEEAQDWERYFIYRNRSRFRSEYNLTEGGDGIGLYGYIANGRPEKRLAHSIFLKKAWQDPEKRKYFMRHNKPMIKGEYSHSEGVKLKMRGLLRKNSQRVLCVETNVIYASCDEASRHFLVSATAIRNSCKIGYKCKNRHFNFYIDEKDRK